MVERSASIAQVEANAARSYELSLAAAGAAESGMNAVRETIVAMEQIRRAVVSANDVVARLGERSTAIGRILNVIEDVAEQTNLLALNAAILAAQAGEHGKGFSVVATEIREVAQYVRQAMVEQKSGSSMISSSTEQMIDMIHQIFQAATDQSRESEKIMATMEHVRTIAEGNRTSANEMSDALTMLSDAIRSLEEEVRKFRVRS